MKLRPRIDVLPQIWRVRFQQTDEPSFVAFGAMHVDDFLCKSLVGRASTLAVLTTVHHVGHPPDFASPIETTRQMLLNSFSGSEVRATGVHANQGGSFSLGSRPSVKNSPSLVRLMSSFRRWFKCIIFNSLFALFAETYNPTIVPRPELSR